jgi:TonB-linked SusC/RagA family outer membrane protein
MIMKLIVIIMTTCFLQVSASSFAQKMTMVRKNTTLAQVLKEITLQTGFEVLYADQKIDLDKNIAVNFNNTELKEVLETCLKDQNLGFAIEDKVIVIKRKSPTFLERVVDHLAAIDVHGRVVDQEGKPLPGATIKVKSTGKSVSANAKGEFYIEKIEKDVILVISFMGYVNKEVSVEREIGDVVLEVSDNILDQVQVIAYGTTTRRLSTGNVSTVKAQDIAKSPVSNPLAAIMGKVPGVVITQNSGVPGAGFSIQIRGRNSLNADNAPLYVIDGIPYNSISSTGIPAPGSPSYSNPLGFINPQDIESIDILKDADATSIYGSRGANGVVLITSKKGQLGKINFNINLQQGTARVVNKLDLLNTQQYIDLRKEALLNDKITLDPNNDLNRYFNADLLIWNNSRYTDWQKQLIGNTAHYTDGELSISGGTLNTQYRIGGGYHRESTVFLGSGADNRGSVSFNVTSRSSDERVKIVLSGNYLTDLNRLPNIDLTGSSVTLAPNAPNLYNVDGSLNWEPAHFFGQTFATFQNPLSSLKNTYKRKADNLLSSFTISYQILKGLTFQTNMGYSSLIVDDLITNPLSAKNPFINFTSIDRTSQFANSTIKTWNVDPQIIFSTVIKNINISALVGTSFQKSTSNAKRMDASNFSSDYLMEDIQSASNITIGGAPQSEYKYNSVFARLSLNSENKYLLNVNIRRDGSTRFGPEKRFGNFGAVGLGWIFTNEDFLKQSNLLSFGKIRFSYGTTGNDGIGDYGYIKTYSSSGNPYQGSKGLDPDNISNPDYAWEINKKLEGGLELGFAKDRILFSLSYYRNRSDNQLVGDPLPQITGFQSVIANSPALVENKGVEITLNSINIKATNFSWKTDLNLTIARNKLISFPDFIGSGYEYSFMIGQPLNIERVYKYNDVDPATGQYRFVNKDGNITLTPENNVLTDRSFVIDLNPKYFGGINNAFVYKDFSLDFFFQFVKQMGKNYLYNGIPGTFNQGGNQPATILNRWKTPGDITDIQKLSQNGSLNNSLDYARISNLFYSDASFIRLKNLSFSYSIPKSISKRLHFDNTRLYILGQNLLTFTNYKGLDPETMSNSTLPPLKTFTFGIQVGL